MMPGGRRQPDSAAGLRGATRASAAMLVLGLVGLGAFVWSFGGFLSRIEASEATPTRHAEGAVALTGGADRIAEAIELVVNGKADRLLITGVNPLTSRAEIARQVPQARALFGCCIELGYEAANTVGNAAETERWVRTHHIRSLIVVTSNYHMPRAMAEIGSALPDIDLISYPVVSDRGKARPWWSDGQSARLIVSEYFKYVASLVRLSLTPPKQDLAEEAAR